MQLCDDKVLVIARIPYQRRTVMGRDDTSGFSRHVVIVVLPNGAEKRLDGERRVGRVELGNDPNLELFAVCGVRGCRCAIHTVEIERSSTEIANHILDDNGIEGS